MDRHYSTQDEAQDALVADVDDPSIDNHRFAYLDDEDGVAAYEDRRREGCCGSRDVEVVIAGRAAIIGCNYGH